MKVQLDVEAEQDDVPVLDLIFLPLDAQLPGHLGSGPAAESNEYLEVDDLGFYEPPLKIGVNDAGSLGANVLSRTVQARTCSSFMVKKLIRSRSL